MMKKGNRKFVFMGKTAKTIAEMKFGKNILFHFLILKQWHSAIVIIENYMNYSPEAAF